MTRLIFFLFFLILLFILAVGTLYYLQDYYPKFYTYLCLETKEFGPYFQSAIEKAKSYDIPSWSGIALAFAIAGIYLLGAMMNNLKRKERRKSSFASYFFCIVLTFALSAFFAIYYWPTDTIQIGDLFTIKRGPREVFFNNAVHIGILVATFHMFIFLLMNLHHCLFYRPQEKHYPRTYDN